eukprot:scaffold1537_cov162-Ochromonas_danica.AAC.7
MMTSYLSHGLMFWKVWRSSTWDFVPLVTSVMTQDNTSIENAYCYIFDLASATKWRIKQLH